ncbi:tRNA(Ile)-lysidine synthase [Candidatus Phytoplasma mali]|uniref:tRNA(Ile)-lysidine synthase n=1 Tax=Phytoplasma mali (strain AT) TaxID=482235 RepID=B3QZS2_PHYMT|nr:tRNA lysidine(34) synthetase TilS [Candidatus Phytoplasma mali]CAP18459.1 tRNA(Ile)-lysidine synthase [Candidatus Phytoplasma mali]
MCISLSINLNKKLFYIISVSGGVDSMVLLNVLFHKNIRLAVVHFNHLKRKESFKDKILVENYCLKNNIPFFYFEIKPLSNNFQNESRLLRQKNLQSVALLYRTYYIITAHHLDDLAENIFMKISRGSSLLGYSGGMQVKQKISDFYFLKPFLYVNKKEILNYAKKNNIHYLDDITNTLDIYKRNEIRNQIIPWFKKDINFLKHIKIYHFQLLGAHKFIRNETKNFFKLQNSNLFCLKIFLDLHSTVQKDIILFLFENKNIFKNFNLLQDIIKGLKEKLKPNLCWDISKNFQFVKSYDHFFLLDKTKKSLKQFKKPILCMVLFLELINFIFNHMCQIYYDNLLLPLKLRHRKQGDIIKFLYGTKKLKSFLIEKKIPLYKREELWLIVDDQDQILWIPQIYINKTLGKKNNCYLILK